MSKLLATLTAPTQDFDLEEWKEDGCPCVKCNLSMRLDDACGWPDDPRLLLCRDCTTDLLSESLGCGLAYVGFGSYVEDAIC